MAVLLTTTPEPTGQPFAMPEDLRSLRKSERQERVEAAAAERLSILAERQAEAERKRSERGLQL